MPTTTITSLSNPRVKQVVKLREHRTRRKTGLFIAEGQREVERAMVAGLMVDEVYVCPALLGDDHASLSHWLPEALWINRADVTEQVFRKMAYMREPEGLLAVVRQPRWTLADVASPTLGARGFYLVAVGTEKPGNLGAMVRTAAAAGCDAVLAAGVPVDAFNPNAIRTSTGAVFSLPVISENETTIRQWLIDQRIRLIASVVTGGIAYDDADYSGAAAIIIGSEDAGLDEDWLDMIDQNHAQRVTIPMQTNRVDSLNASNAAAILLFEAARQRRGR